LTFSQLPPLSKKVISASGRRKFTLSSEKMLKRREDSTGPKK
jgi:hypothetical protein